MQHSNPHSSPYGQLTTHTCARMCTAVPEATKRASACHGCLHHHHKHPNQGRHLLIFLHRRVHRPRRPPQRFHTPLPHPRSRRRKHCAPIRVRFRRGLDIRWMGGSLVFTTTTTRATTEERAQSTKYANWVPIAPIVDGDMFRGQTLRRWPLLCFLRLRTSPMVSSLNT